MKAIAVHPGKPNSVHLAELPMPRLEEIADGRGVLVKMLKVGVDATDREINEAKYGNAPPGYDFLVLGHESFGVVKEVGVNVRHVRPGDYVTLTVRRPGGSIYDLIGTNDMTSEETYYERGINLRHGYLTEYVVDDAEYVVKMPPGLTHLHVLAEPMSCAVKAVQQAYEAQRRLKVWRPQSAFVLGAGQIGLLTSLVLRLKGLHVYTLARSPAGTLSSEIAAGIGAEYVSTQAEPLMALTKRVGKPDIIVDASGNSAIAFEAMQALGLNGVLVWTSVTGGTATATVPSDKLNLEWVLGNKLLVGSVNGNREHFESGIRDFALCEKMWPGVIGRILTHELHGLDSYAEMMDLLVHNRERHALKVYVEIAKE